MGGARLLPWEYDRLDYWTIFNVYLAPHDKDTSELIPLRQRLGLMPAQTADVAAAQAKRPTIEQLDIPREAWLMGVPLQYVRMFWETWRADVEGRRKTSAETLELFRAKLGQCVPRGGFESTHQIVQTLDAVQTLAPQTAHGQPAGEILTLETVR